MAVVQIPPLKLFVPQTYLTKDDSYMPVSVYLVSIKAIPYKALSFTVYTEHGALFSGLPIESLTHNSAFFEMFIQTRFMGFPTEELQPYSCLEGPIQYLKYSFLEHAECKVRLSDNKPFDIKGNYMFTLDYLSESGFGDDPEQYKSHNFIALENGQIAALPNNFIEYNDNYFKVDKDPSIQYRRNSKRYYAGG